MHLVQWQSSSATRFCSSLVTGGSFRKTTQENEIIKGKNLYIHTFLYIYIYAHIFKVIKVLDREPAHSSLG